MIYMKKVIYILFLILWFFTLTNLVYVSNNSCKEMLWEYAITENDWTCWCQISYMIVNWKCESMRIYDYLILREFDYYSNQAIVTPIISEVWYILTLENTNNLNRIEDFLWKAILINKWEDWKINVWDLVILTNTYTITNISSKVLKIEEFTINQCQALYWLNAIDVWDNMCWCRNWYIWNDKKTTCIYSSSNTSKNTCSDMINWFLASDGNCYCNSWYYWSNTSNKCILETNTPILSTPTTNENNCPDNAYRNTSWICVCNNWYEWSGNDWKCIKNKDALNNELINEKAKSIYEIIKQRFSKYSYKQKIILYTQFSLEIDKLLKTNLPQGTLLILEELNKLIKEEIILLQ